MSRRPHSPCLVAHGGLTGGRPWCSLSLVSSLVQRNKVVAKRKGAIAAVTAGGAAVIAVAGAPIVAVVAAAGAAYLAWDWLSFRLKNGMRF